MQTPRPSIDALMLGGPTASGKSEWAMALAERIPIEIVSVDSTQVYRGLDIGSAKPSAESRASVPHHLIDIRDPHEHYSAGAFVADVLPLIAAINERGRLPVLVGGTMLYFNALVRGLAELPASRPDLRAAIDARAARAGWPALHAELEAVDPDAATRIRPTDAQRIQRALEVFEATGRSLSDWQRGTAPAHGLRCLRWALLPADRAALHARIATRFESMLAAGWLEEIRRLQADPRLHPRLPALRSVGYRQLWSHVAGEAALPEAIERGIAATRQLAKRQMTWIRGDAGWQSVDPGAAGALQGWLTAVQTVSQRAYPGTRS